MVVQAGLELGLVSNANILGDRYDAFVQVAVYNRPLRIDATVIILSSVLFVSEFVEARPLAPTRI